MKQTDEKVYRCDFCNRAIVSKGSMVLHEKMCKKNPNNQHQCFKYCKNLVKEQCDDGLIHFYCSKKEDIELYSYKLERYKCNQSRVDTLKRMPLECELYEIQDGHNFDTIEYCIVSDSDSPFI